MSKKWVLVLAILISGITFSVIAISMALKELPIDDEVLNPVEVDEVIEDVVTEEVAYEEVILQKAIEMLYTVSDVNEFEYYMDINEVYNETLEIGKEISRGFSEICTEDGLIQIMSNRLFLPYMEAAYFNEFTISVQQLDYEIYFEKVGDGSILNPYDKVGYEYEVELLLIYLNGDEETIFEDGYIHFGMADGEWKVDQLSCRLLNDIFIPNYLNE